MEHSNIIVIKAVSFERVSGKYWAHHSAGRFTLTESEYTEMYTAIRKTGKFEIVKRGSAIYDARTLAEILSVVF